jgi:hypothetical protein
VSGARRSFSLRLVQQLGPFCVPDEEKHHRCGSFLDRPAVARPGGSEQGVLLMISDTVDLAWDQAVDGLR